MRWGLWVVILAGCSLVDPLDDVSGGSPRPDESASEPEDDGPCRPANGTICYNGVCRCGGGSNDQDVCDRTGTGADSCERLCNCRP